MKKVILHWTSSDGGFGKWLEKEYFMNETNYKEIINQYYSETKMQAQALSDKWDIDGNPDTLYLDFTLIDISPDLFGLIDNHMEDIS